MKQEAANIIQTVQFFNIQLWLSTRAAILCHVYGSNELLMRRVFLLLRGLRGGRAGGHTSQVEDVAWPLLKGEGDFDIAMC